MKFVNDTPYPALSFEGIDQLSQIFHVVVMRVTCTWNDKGLLQPSDEQDPLCVVDVIADEQDLMSGVIEESDLCHYKPNCDILVVGSAYTPKYKQSSDRFECRLQVKTPDKYLFDTPIPASKYLFAGTNTKPKCTQFVKGKELVNKTLSVLAPRTAFLEARRLNGELNYTIQAGKLPPKTPLHPKASFGGYCYLEESDPRLSKFPDDKRINPPIAANTLNANHAPLVYFCQNNHNPYGTGYLNKCQSETMPCDVIKLPVIHHPSHILTTDHLAQMSQDKLSDDVYNVLTTGFGVRSKTHPNRHRFLGEIDEDYLQNKTPTPKNFDFAVWNAAYPDQQTNVLVGNEWITLTNLSSLDTKATHLDDEGNHCLTLYLPEMVAYLATISHQEDFDASEVPMKLDTVIIRPDEEKVHLVWRGIIAGEYNPNTTVLQTKNRHEVEQTLATYFTQKGTIIRPYESQSQEAL